MPLENFQILDIKNEFTFFIWSCELKVIVKRKVGSQIAGLIPNH
jgi:hypothetical protein